MAFLDLARLRESRLQREPFEFVVVENFLRADALSALVAAFPLVAGHGSYPLATVACDPLFGRLTEELEGEAMRHAIEEKFAVDLDGRPTMITLRGYSDGKDGAIHTDSATKIITVLIYMNPEWHEAAGRLRLLRGPDGSRRIMPPRSRRWPGRWWRFAAAPGPFMVIMPMLACAARSSSTGSPIPGWCAGRSAAIAGPRGSRR